VSDSSGASYIEGMTASFRAQLLDAMGAPVDPANVRMIVLAPNESASFTAPSTVLDGFVYGTVNLDRPGVWRYRFETTLPPHAVLEDQFTVTRRTVPAPAGPGGVGASVAPNWRINELPAVDPLQTSDLIAISRGSPAESYRATLEVLRDLIGGYGSGGGASDSYITPEQYGAIGDGASHPAGTTLGLSTLQDLQEWENGRYAFADSLNNEVDYLAIQAALYAGGVVRGKPKAHYKIDHFLTHPNGWSHPNFVGCKLNFVDFTLQEEGANLLTNHSFDSGSAGWTQGTLTPRTNIVFSGGKASFTDPPISANATYGDFGQQVTLPVGKWTVRIRLVMSEGASAGFYGPPYVNIGFRPDGVGLGGYEWPHPLSFGFATSRGGDFDGWLKFDVEVLEPTTAWLDIQGGNCDWEVQEAEIKPFGMNYAVWCTGDDLGLGDRYDVSTWIGGDFLGPVSKDTDIWVGPEVGGFLHKSFRGEGPRCNMRDLILLGFDVGVGLSDQAFLQHFIGVNVGNCRTAIKYYAGSVNSGENFRWSHCVIFNSDLAMHAEGGAEWNFWGTSFDFCDRMVLLERAAKVSFKGHHFEFRGTETRFYLNSPTGTWGNGTTITGGTSGATGRIVEDRHTFTRPHLVLHVLTGTFVDGETITCSAGGTATANGAVQFGAAMFDLRGGSMVDFHGEFIQQGGSHQGAPYMFHLETNADVWSNSDWWAYGLHTASGTLCTGFGRFVSRRLIGPTNAELPDMIMRTHAMDRFAGSGRISGPGTVTDMGFGGPSDGVGFLFGAHSAEASGAATARGVIPWEQAVEAVTGVTRTTGHGSLRLQYNSAFSGDTELRVYIPVQPGEAVLADFWYSKPDAKAAVAHGPYSAGAAPNEIWVNTTLNSAIATVQDHQVQQLATYGPQAGWTVTLAGVTGNPGGIANAVWNATHTIIARTDNQYEDGRVRYTIDLGAPATADSMNAGGGSIQTTYSQTNVLIFDRRFWCRVLYNDALGRPVLGQTAYQGEANFLLPHAALDWTRKTHRSWYTEAVIPNGEPLSDRAANGRAPEWASHYMIVINWPTVRHIDVAAPPPWYITDFFANVL
jgi:hypothetical protein